MDFFFNPRGIALIGASATPMKGGHSILQNLKTGFAGPIHPVNPRYEEIEGLTCYRSVREVPDPADLAIVFVPAGRVPAVIADCAARGIRGVMIESGGFAESGEPGRALQNEALEIAAAHGMRLWGPNGMGLVDARRGYVFSFVSPTIWDEGLIGGEVSLVVQSGMLSGAYLIDVMTRDAVGISKVCSIGNKMDVNECDLLAYLMEDDHTAVIGMYLESLADGRRLLELCRRSPKPVVMLKGGKSAGGARAALSHTASLAGDGAVIAGALAQAGVVEATDFQEMTDLCRTLAMVPSAPAGTGGVAVLTYSGGAGIVSADHMEARGLPLAELAPETRQAMRRVFPDWMPVSNPVDLWPAVERSGADAAYQACLEAVCADPGVRAVLLHCFVGGFRLNPDLEALARTAGQSGKPLFCWTLGQRDAVRAFQQSSHAIGVPIYREIGRTVACMAAALAPRPAPKASDTPAAARLAAESADRAALRETDTGVMDEYRAKQVLAGAGIPTVREEIVLSAEAAARLAERWARPVAVKGLVAGAVHKTEQGLVHLNLATPEAVRRAAQALCAAMPAGGRILVQEQVIGQPELIAGLVRDAQFGPCVMIGLGGIFAEALGDTVFAVAPLDTEEARALIGRLKHHRLLHGFRGSVPVDTERLAGILVALGRLGIEAPRIREIDINPLILAEGIPVAVDATIVLDAGADCE